MSQCFIKTLEESFEQILDYVRYLIDMSQTLTGGEGSASHS
jgi:hypothetical protein